MKDKSFTDNIFGIKDNETIMWGFYCMAFVGYTLTGKNVFDYTNLLSANDYKNNGKIMYKYF